MLKAIGMAGLLLWGGLACAQGSVAAAAAEKPVTETSAAPEWLSAFTRCDGEFFRALKRDAGDLRRVTPMGEQGEYAWIRVPDRTANEKRSSVLFQDAVWVGGLQLVGYHDTILHEGPERRMDSWGFTVLGNLDEVAKILRPFVFEAERFQQNGEMYFRFEVKSETGDAWVPEGIIPGDGRGLKKSFGLLQTSAELGLLNMMCIVRADEGVSITEIRPDLVFVEAEAKTEAFPEDETLIPVEVPRGVRAATAALGPKSDWWKLKFRQLYYVQKANLPAGVVKHETALMPLGSDIFGRFSANSPFAEDVEDFQEEVLTDIYMLGGLMPLQESLPSGVWVTKKVLSLALPEKLAPGERLSVELKQLELNSSQERTVAYQCEFGKPVPAREIFKMIPGRAIPVQCGKSEGYFFLEDFGVVITLLEGYEMVGFEVE